MEAKEFRPIQIPIEIHDKFRTYCKKHGLVMYRELVRMILEQVKGEQNENNS